MFVLLKKRNTFKKRTLKFPHRATKAVVLSNRLNFSNFHFFEIINSLQRTVIAFKI